MSSMNLKRNGPIARYLGFVVNRPIYCPKSFCSLFWMLLFSPVLLFFIRINMLWDYVTERIRNAIDANHKKQVQDLVNLYKNNPQEAVRDYYEHFIIYRELPWSKRKRDFDLVHEAFNKLQIEFSVYHGLDVLVSLKAIPDPNRSYVIAASSNWRKNTPTWKSNLLQLLNVFFPILLILAVTTFVLIPWIIAVPEVALIFCGLWTILLLSMICYRLEGHVVLYNVYKAVKDRACPLITWD